MAVWAFAIRWFVTLTATVILVTLDHFWAGTTVFVVGSLLETDARDRGEVEE